MTDDLDFAIGEVATMLAMTPATIRACERRYQAIDPRRTAGGQRRYSVDDIAELHRIKALVASGRSVRLAALEQQGLNAEPLPVVAPTLTAAPAAVSGEAWKAVADVLPLLVLFLTPSGRVADANAAVIEAFHTSREALLGTSFATLVHAYDRSKAVKLYTTPLTRRRGWELNLRIVPPRTCAFDSWLVSEGSETLIILVGRVVECAAPDPPRPPKRTRRPSA